MITLIYPYYDSPEMFKIHQKNWLSYSEEFRNKLRIIVVDDCSQRLPAKDAVILKGEIPFSLYRIKVDVAWNWRSARNIGAYEAEKDSWLFMTDMDLLIPEHTISGLFKRLDSGWLSKNNFYTFDRVIAPDMRQYKNHPNTYFFHQDLYRKIGGYDECVSGIYGLDGVFRRRLERGCMGAVHLKGLKIVFYQRDYVFDASVSTLPRKENRDTEEVQKARQILKSRFQKGIMPDVCTFPYERII